MSVTPVSPSIKAPSINHSIVELFGRAPASKTISCPSQSAFPDETSMSSPRSS